MSLVVHIIIFFGFNGGPRLIQLVDHRKDASQQEEDGDRTYVQVRIFDLSMWMGVDQRASGACYVVIDVMPPGGGAEAGGT